MHLGIFCKGSAGHLLAALAGGLITLSLAPFDLWPLGILCCALLAWLLEPLTAKQAALRGWFFGFGLFGSGISWVYVSIHTYGYTSVPLAIFITALFAAALAFFGALTGYLYHRFLLTSTLAKTLGFACLWVLSEWLRGWFLSGLPWLYLGYGHIDSPLAGWAPVGSVFLISFIVAYSGAVLAQSCIQQRFLKPQLAIVCLLWITGFILQSVNWVTASPQAPIKVAMVQANISQSVKWDPQHYQTTLQTYQRLSQPLWKTNSLVIWPEAAIPGFYHYAKPFLDTIADQASSASSSLITGVPFADYDANGRHNYNSVIALGNGKGLYHKQRLVPFGEYVPFESLLRGLIRFFNLPMSAFSAGSSDQGPLHAAGLTIAPLICYEIAYANLVSKQLPKADVLLTISNDAWFGASIGPLQHLQIAQMRALEAGRFLIRSTGNGVSAIIDSSGHIRIRGAQFRQEIIQGEIYVMQGTTPFALTGTWPIIALSLLGCLICYYLRNKHTIKPVGH